jgi:hypothetical protein
MGSYESKGDGRIKGGYQIVGVRILEILGQKARARRDRDGHRHNHGATGIGPPTTGMVTQIAPQIPHTGHGTTIPPQTPSSTTLLHHLRSDLPADGIQRKNYQSQRCRVYAHSINRIQRRSAMRCSARSLGCRGKLWRGLLGVDSGMSSSDGTHRCEHVYASIHSPLPCRIHWSNYLSVLHHCLETIPFGIHGPTCEERHKERRHIDH